MSPVHSEFEGSESEPFIPMDSFSDKNTEFEI